MKKVLLAGYYGHDNLGDEAIAEALTKELKRRGYEIIMLSGDKVTSAQIYGVDTYDRGKLAEIKNAIEKCDFLPDKIDMNEVNNILINIRKTFIK